jgi:hypothetical protein
MDANDPRQSDAGAGMSGVLKAIAAFAVVVIAAIGVLVVLEVIPREMMQEWFTKGVLLVLILGGAGIALALLGRGSGR